MQTSADLKNLLARIDRRGYPAYKDTRGAYQFPGYVLSIDHVQGDPFAAPSKLSIHVSGKTAGFPRALYETRCRRLALQDELTRQFGRRAAQFSFQAKGSGQSGLISVSRCGPEVLERTACRLDPERGDVLLRLEVGFPANGRTINARELEKILFDFLPRCVQETLCCSGLDGRRLRAVAQLADDQQYIRQKLPELGLCAFVADGSILPRESGVSSRPMKGAVPFRAPRELAVTLDLPNRGKITGMGIPRGITLIVGGGYHGKSTLLKALELGVYDHVAGDGREYVITDRTAVKIRAEDGRSIRRTDISMFINGLPNGKDTVSFETEVLDCDNYQGNAVVNYTDYEVPYTRIIEHKHFEFGTQEKTVISREYSTEWKPGMEPYYPVNDEKNSALYRQYCQLAEKEGNVIFGGRLGQYKYYDMDQVIEAALAVAENEAKQW